MWRLAIFAIIVAAALVGFVGPATQRAAAHQDGCHRWHSCPSDSGSYTCGDTGYTSGCGGGLPEANEPDDPSYAEPDSDSDDADPYGLDESYGDEGFSDDEVYGG